MWVGVGVGRGVGVRVGVGVGVDAGGTVKGLEAVASLFATRLPVVLSNSDAVGKWVVPLVV